MNPEVSWYEGYENDPGYQFELLSLAIGEGIVEAVQRLGVTRSQMAERRGVSEPRVTQILAGDENLTLRTLATVANALDARPRVTFERPGAAAASRHPLVLPERLRTLWHTAHWPLALPGTPGRRDGRVDRRRSGGR